MECIAQFHGLACTENCLFAGKCPFRTHPDLGKHLCHTVAGIKIIVYHQGLKTFQLCDPLCAALLRLNPQCQADNHLRTLSLLRLNLNGSTHHIHNILGDSHTKSCALDSADRGGAFPLKRRKQLLGKFQAHADSVILDPDLIQRTVLLCPRELLEPDRNGSSCRGKLDRIGQKIQQHLVQPRFITIDILVRNIHGIHIKVQLLCIDLAADDRLQIMKDI